MCSVQAGLVRRPEDRCLASRGAGGARCRGYRVSLGDEQVLKLVMAAQFCKSVRSVKRVTYLRACCFLKGCIFN